MDSTHQSVGADGSASRQLVLGMGTGRCGTHTLAEILSRQPDANVTHEQPPLIDWQPRGSTNPVLARLERIRRTRPQKLVGDVASFYLPYIESLLQTEPRLRVVCLERPREEVVKSFCSLLDTSFPLPTDHWSDRPRDGWHHEPVWTRVFPQYPVSGREDGIRRYWDEYHSRASDLARRFPENVRVFPMAATLSTEAGMRAMLDFVGVPRERQVISLEVRHAPAAEVAPHPRRALLAEAGPNDPVRCAVLVQYPDHVAPGCEDGLRALERRGYPVFRVAARSGAWRAMNQMAMDALTEGFEETLWIGHDILFQPDDVERLRALNVPITCGLYPEVGEMVPAFDVLPETRHVLFGAAGGVIEVSRAPGGFMLVRRSVYMEMAAKLNLPLCYERNGRPHLPFFQTEVVPVDEGYRMLDGDLAFCDRARRCGFKVQADSSIRLWRSGSYAYSWEDAGMTLPRYGTFHLNIG